MLQLRTFLDTRNIGNTGNIEVEEEMIHGSIMVAEAARSTSVGDVVAGHR